jgi:hypothetical protein
MAMTWRTVIITVGGILLLCTPAYAVEGEPAVRPGFNPMLNQALKGEGGVQVYMDKEGNVGTVTDAGTGHRTFSVQPPQSPSINLGPPLQLHNKSLSFPLNPSQRGPGDRPPALAPAR